MIQIISYTFSHPLTHAEITVPSFSAQSYITYAIPPVTSANFSLTLSLRATNSSGLILYNQGTNGSYISLQLENGQLVLQYRLALKPVVTVVGSFYPIDDAFWHTIRISLIDGVGMMLIDHQVFISAPVPTVKLPVVSFYTPLYVGGIDNFSLLPLSVNHQSTGLIGCVDRIYINHSQVDLLLDALIVNQISQCRMDACNSSACSNNGVCIEKSVGYDCTCMLGYTGENCEQGNDIVHSYNIMVSSLLIQ